MKFKQKEIVSILILLVMLINITNLVNAAFIGISPASLEFKEVLRGGYSERNVIISVDSDNLVNVNVETRGEISSWLNFSTINFNLTRESPYSLKVMVMPSRDTPNGEYSGFVRLSTSRLGEGGTDGQAVSAVKSALDLFVRVEIIDREIVSCSVRNVEILSAEKGDDIIINFDFMNTGNIRLKPSIDIKLWDSEQSSLIKNPNFIEGDVLPSTEEKISLRMDSNDLIIGQFFAEMNIPDCYFSNFYTFDVMVPGALKADGSIVEMFAKKNAQVGDTLPIYVLFKNTGEKEVEAQFKGKINLGNGIVQILESEKIKVPVSSIYQYNFFFTPKEAGNFIVSGRVYYASKKTFESSTSFTVFSRKSELRNYILYSIYGILFLIIMVLIFKINRERKSNRQILRRIR